MAVDARSVGDRAASASGTDAGAFSASSAYRSYVVWLLFVIYVFNYCDRQILSIVLEQIKLEFELHDWQLGMLSGLAFAAFYSTLGIPIARMADTRNRVNIISASIVIWSGFTAVSGLAQNFWHLLIARIGVGVGEAGASPSSYSIISDYVEPKKRATALSIYSMGVYGGSALGFFVGGMVAHAYGCRLMIYDNDIFSYKKEMKEGEAMNIVLVLQAEHKISIDEALILALEMRQIEYLELLKFKKCFKEFGNYAGIVKNYWQNTMILLEGQLNWYKLMSKRYE